MRIHKENNQFTVSACVEMDIPETNSSDELQLKYLMENYAIPLTIEMANTLFRALVKDIQKSSNAKKTYVFSLTAKELDD